jgi:hypothetical protein
MRRLPRRSGGLGSVSWFGAVAVRLLLVVPLLGLCSACGGGDDDEGYSGVSLAELAMAECAKVSVCTGAAADSCFLKVANNGAWNPLEEPGAYENGLELRAECMAAAESCDQVLACIDEGQQAYDDEQAALAAQASCLPENGDYIYCEDGLLFWCAMGEYDDVATPYAVDIEALGKTCNAAGSYAADPDHPACDGADFTLSCDGTGVVECVGGERVTWDCRAVDPEFVCASDGEEFAECTLPADAIECEDGNYNNYGEWSQCEGGAAQVCAAGKFYDVGCSTFLSASCEQEDNSTEYPDAYCRI